MLHQIQAENFVVVSSNIQIKSWHCGPAICYRDGNSQSQCMNNHNHQWKAYWGVSTLHGNMGGWNKRDTKWKLWSVNSRRYIPVLCACNAQFYHNKTGTPFWGWMSTSSHCNLQKWMSASNSEPLSHHRFRKSLLHDAYSWTGQTLPTWLIRDTNAKHIVSYTSMMTPHVHGTKCNHIAS